MAYSVSDEHSDTLLSDMAALVNILGLSLWLYLASQGSTTVVSESPALANGTVLINGAASSIGLIDEDFICATMDWWPPSKCDYGTCSWGTASLLNLVSFSLIFYLGFCMIFTIIFNNLFMIETVLGSQSMNVKLAT